MQIVYYDNMSSKELVFNEIIGACWKAKNICVFQMKNIFQYEKSQ